jgi:uncharacterized protein
LKSDSQKSGFYAKWGKLFLLSAFLIAPLAFYGAGKAVESNVNKVEDWLPATFRETGELKWFRTHFPTDQFVIISWDGCRIAGNPEVAPWEEDDPRIAKLANLLIPPESAQDPDSIECRKYFKSVTTGRQVLDQLIAKPLELPFDEAVERLKGSLLGPDGRQTCVIVNLNPEASTALKKVLGRGQYRLLRPSVPPGVLRRQIAAAGVGMDSLHLGGPPVDNISIDEEGERTLIRLAGLSGLLGLFLAWWSLRSVMLTAVVFFCGVLSAASALALIWITGETVDAIVLSMPSLVYVLAISGAVHLINYYRDAVQEGGIEGAAERAVVHAFKPALLCSVTTAVGLFSLNASELVPIRKFGIYSAAGVMLMLLVVFFFIPAALPATGIAKKWLSAKSSKEDEPVNLSDSFWQRVFATICGWIIRRHALVTISCLAFIATVSFGLTRTKTSIDLLELFDSRAKILQDYRWLENNLGMLVPLEIVVRFSPESQALEKTPKADPTEEDLFQLTFLERMETVVLIQDTIEKQFGVSGQGVVGQSLSAATFAPNLPPATGDSQTFLHRRVVNARLLQSRDQFAGSGFLKVDKDGSELWRISVRVAAFEGVDYGQFVHELHDTVQPIMEAHKHRVEILRSLAENRADQGINGCRVFLWDKPISVDQAELSDEEASKIKNHRAMVTALASMLKTARLNVVRGEKSPNEIPLAKIQQLGKIDRVVLVGPFADSEASLLSSALGNVIDLHAPLPKLASQAENVAASDEPWLSAVYTGVVPIVYKAQRALLASLISSTFWSFATITPLMIFVARGIRPGLVAMIPNVLPVLAVFGGMGWLNIPVDIGSMMTASIALGVAVDDTIHYLSWFRTNIDQLRNRNEAIISSYKSAAVPTLQTAVISGLGLSVFAFSTFTPTQRFGWLMLAILIAGVVAELVMLPAILAGPLGKCFEVNRRRRPLQRWLLIARYELRRRKDQRLVVQDVRRAA